MTLRRTNDIEAEMQLKFSGSISAVTVDGTQKNSVVYVRYRYKKTSESSYGSYTSIYSGTTKAEPLSATQFGTVQSGCKQLLRLSLTDPRQALFLEQSGSVFYCPAGYAAHCASEKEGRHQHARTRKPRWMLPGICVIDRSADFVIQQGTSGIWNYLQMEKRHSGVLGSVFLYDRHFDGMGVLYESGAIALPNFPFTFEIPHVHISTENSNYAMFVERGSSRSWSTTTNPGKIFAVRPNTVPSATYKISIYAIGKVTPGVTFFIPILISKEDKQHEKNSGQPFRWCSPVSAAGPDGSWEDVTACFTRFWLS